MKCVRPREAPAAVLDYPRGDATRAAGIAEALEAVGVEAVCFEGPATLPGGYRVLGRGHASVVLLAVLGGAGPVAVKVRRSDSKRDSLILECSALRRSWPVAPKVHRCTDEFIIMDLVNGPPVAEVARYSRGCREAVTLIAKVAEAARWLDRVGVCHEELSDLRGHAFLSGGAVKLVDFESASMRYCCTVCKVLSWALYRSLLTSKCPPLAAGRERIREAVRAYKRGPTHEAFTRIIELLREAAT